MTNTWFVMIPPQDVSKTDSEKETVDFRIQYPYPSKAWTDANAGRVVQGAEGNTGNPQVSEPLVKWKGPFATEAAAKKAQNPKQFNPNPLKDPGQTGTSILGGLSGIGDFFGRLTEANTWIRVGEVVLGLILFAVGLARITKAVPVATKIAKTVGAVAI